MKLTSLDPEYHNQYRWVAHCYEQYELLSMTPGDPNDGIWHWAHYPIPQCLGGEHGLWLLDCDHAVHGILQSEEMQHQCIFGWENKFLHGDLLDLYGKWKNRKTVTLLNPDGLEVTFPSMYEAAVALGVLKHHIRRLLRGERYSIKGYTVPGTTPPAYGTDIIAERRRKNISLISPQAEILKFRSYQEAADYLQVHRTSIQKLASGKRKTCKGHKLASPQ